MIFQSPDERPQPVPAEYGGKWIVWNKEGTCIVGVGATLEDAEQEAKEHGETETISEWIPPARTKFISCTIARVMTTGCDKIHTA